ncbi:MAG: energy-coupling factor transporter transmembrane protein EcfT [Candidatus Aenigmarchaeota archaeon]|nr:energy-coupling factor transporter transmembrane protein EcfT [Candidatus Aenigmarchaeota archaeon]
MKFYQYIHRDSAVHRLDPRAKLLWLLLFSSIVFITQNEGLVLAIFGLTLLFAALAKLPKGQIWENTKFFVILMPIAYLVLYFLLLGISAEAFWGSLVFSARFLVLIFASVIFTMTTSTRDLMLALSKLKLPYSFVFMLTVAIRFIPVIMAEINNVICAQKVRCYNPELKWNSPVESMKRFVPILIPVLMLLLKRANELALSVESRAFNPKGKVTYPERLKFRAWDWAFTLAIIGLFLFVLWA